MVSSPETVGSCGPGTWSLRRTLEDPSLHTRRSLHIREDRGPSEDRVRTGHRRRPRYATDTTLLTYRGRRNGGGVSGVRRLTQ